MPKGVPNKRYTPEFKKIVNETMLKEKLSYAETRRRFEITGRYHPALRLIFTSYVDCSGMKAIVRMLTEQKHKTPAQIQKMWALRKPVLDTHIVSLQKEIQRLEQEIDGMVMKRIRQLVDAQDLDSVTFYSCVSL